MCEAKYTLCQVMVKANEEIANAAVAFVLSRELRSQANTQLIEI
jgi:hypothetical protein